MKERQRAKEKLKPIDKDNKIDKSIVNNERKQPKRKERHIERERERERERRERKITIALDIKV